MGGLVIPTILAAMIMTRICGTPLSYHRSHLVEGKNWFGYFPEVILGDKMNLIVRLGGIHLLRSQNFLDFGPPPPPLFAFWAQS